MVELDKLRTEAEQIAEKIKNLQVEIDSLDDLKMPNLLLCEKELLNE